MSSPTWLPCVGQWRAPLVEGKIYPTLQQKAAIENQRPQADFVQDRTTHDIPALTKIFRFAKQNA